MDKQCLRIKFNDNDRCLKFSNKHDYISRHCVSELFQDLPLDSKPVAVGILCLIILKSKTLYVNKLVPTLYNDAHRSYQCKIIEQHCQLKVQWDRSPVS